MCQERVISLRGKKGARGENKRKREEEKGKEGKAGSALCPCEQGVTGEGDSWTFAMNELANHCMLASTGDLHCVCPTHVYVHT